MTVSLVSLVGHAEAKLPRMLGFVDADENGSYPFDEYLFLVDDRSTDRTEELVKDFVEVAKANGVKASYELYPFRGDFASAWNKLFSTVTSEWHLHIAADEALVGADSLRSLLSALPADVEECALLFREALVQRPWNHLTRLLRTSAGHRYQGSVHSDLVKRSDQIVRPILLKGPILEHYKSREEWKKSRDAYAEEAWKKAEEEQTGFAWHMAGRCALDAGNRKAALDALTKSIQRIEKLETWTPFAKRLHERLHRAKTKKPPFLGLAVLVKDCALFIDDLLRSVVMPAHGPAFDEYVFVDTGSGDLTVEALERWREFAEEHGVVFKVIEVKDTFAKDGHFNFGAARNFAFEQLTSEWRMWLDADDRLLGSDFLWSLVRNEPAEVNCISMKYDYTGEGEKGSVWQDAKRIFRYPSGAVRWKGRIHEQPVAVGQHRLDAIEAFVEVPAPWGMKIPLHVVHANARHDASVERNEAILEHLHETGDALEKARAAYFLGHLYALRKDKRAKALLKEAIEGMHGNYIGVLASVALAEYLLDTEGNPNAAIDVVGAVHAQVPELPEPLWTLGLAHRMKGDHHRAARFFKEAMALPDPPFRPHRNRLVEELLGPMWTVEALRMAGDLEGARKVLDEKLAGKDDDRIRRLGNTLAHDRYKRDVIVWVEQGVKLLMLAGDGQALEALRDLPKWWFERIPEIRMLRAETKKKIDHCWDSALYAKRYSEAADETALNDKQLKDVDKIDRVLWMKGYIKDGMSVLGVGPNSGHFEASVMHEFPNTRFTLVEATEVGRQRLLDKWKPEFGDRIEVFATLDSDEWPKGPFDVVESFEVIEHVPNARLFLKALWDRITPDGVLLLSTPDVECWAPDMGALEAEWLGHVRGFTPRIFYDLLHGVKDVVPSRCIERMVRSTIGLLLAACRTEPKTNYIGTIDILAVGYVPFDAEAHYRGPLGGSEEAIVHLAPRLAKLGYKVRVYTNTGEKSMFAENPRSNLVVKDNVLWEPIEHFSPDDYRTALISWRSSTVLEMPQFHKEHSGKKLVWLHDAVLGSVQGLAKADAVMCVSKTHETAMQRMAGEMSEKIKWRHIQNGIDPSSFPQVDESKRDPHRAIYMSSPDRGLETLLDLWPEIKEIQPKANLHIYYGFSSARKMSKDQPHLLKTFLQMEERIHTRIAALLDVFWHDGVSHPELHEALRQSAAWLYPHPVSDVETSCITAMKVLASGVWPVVTDAGALRETCFTGSFCKADRLDTPEERHRFVQLAGIALSGEAFDRNSVLVKATPEFREGLRQEALKRFDWDIAAQMVGEIIHGA